MLNLKPSYKPIKAYYDSLREFHSLKVKHEGAVRSAFQNLLEHCCRQVDWKLVPEHPFKRLNQHPLRIDGAFIDDSEIPRGYWEAKDEDDDLEDEVTKKFLLGYPKDNILFQAPERAIIWQNGKQLLDEDITKPETLIDVLHELFKYRPTPVMLWEEAAEQFKNKIPEQAGDLLALIENQRKSNQRFIRAFADFVELCRHSINPNLSEKAVEEMLIQHLLTERIFRTVFQNQDFARRNVIAIEIEKVIDALTSQAFSRGEFLQKLDRLYVAIEAAANSIADFSQKQHFLNSVYEKFFQGFSVKVADTHGIVYTPQSIVNFMVKSVEEILHKEFGRSLSDQGVHILDPFVGTGNFIVRVMQEIKTSKLQHKYENELHCNEVMLLPYYIASMNIEHEYFEKTGQYKPFEGICLVDTFELAEAHQPDLFTAKNTERVERQKQAPIYVIIGNPPYNAGQLNENDNNKNRKYPTMDRRVAETFAKSSLATNKNALSDPYVKAFRWASDRIGDEGVVAYVSNNSFLEQIAFDGMRKQLAHDFDAIYVFDLGGNVRKNPKLSGSTHNVFGIQVGVSITLLIRKAKGKPSKPSQIYYARLDEFWRKEEKYRFLEATGQREKAKWNLIRPDEKNNWLTEGLEEEFDNYTSIGSKDAKAGKDEKVIFELFSNGVKTNRDIWAYNINRDELSRNMNRTIDTYNEQLSKWNRLDKKPRVDEFVDVDDKKLSWSENLKNAIVRGQTVKFDKMSIRTSFYHPFMSSFLYFDQHFTERRYQYPHIFPNRETESENKVICCTGVGSEKPFTAILSNRIVNLSFLGGGTALQCFPFYTYTEKGNNRGENITDWALEEFNKHYIVGADSRPPAKGANGDSPLQKKISKWDIFYYVYALLHHPTYRKRYAANLKRELPRIPFAPDFHAFAEAGKKLATLHVEYEKQKEYKLEIVESKVGHLNYRVEKMKLSKDKRTLTYNEFFTIGGIPQEAFEYRLGNRSALEWIVDQYQISTDKRSGITNDPNRSDDPEYILRLIGQVITVSVETVKIVKGLPGL